MKFGINNFSISINILSLFFPFSLKIKPNTKRVWYAKTLMSENHTRFQISKFLFPI